MLVFILFALPIVCICQVNAVYLTPCIPDADLTFQCHWAFFYSCTSVKTVYHVVSVRAHECGFALRRSSCEVWAWSVIGPPERHLRQSDILTGTKVWPHLQTGLLLCAKTLICRPPQAMYDTLSSVRGHAKRTTWSFAPLALLFFIVSSCLMHFAQLCAPTKTFLFLWLPRPFPQ